MEKKILTTVVTSTVASRELLLEPYSKKELKRKVTVCDKCLKASCWQGVYMCNDTCNAGIIEKTIKELKKLKLENSSYWGISI